VASGAIDALERLRGETAIPIAADEALVSAAARERLIADRGVDVLVLKLALVGGLAQGLRAARAAEAAGMSAYVTSGIDGEVARAAAAHLAAAMPGTRFAHGLAVGALLEEKAKSGWLEPQRGIIALPEAPGLGL
jgi:L-alanine-DL-glutamate epimerase-like enolase superfamily enzyme